MPAISFITPIDQPTGNIRLLNLLRSSLQNPAYTSFLFSVAFAKSGPLLRLSGDLAAFHLRGGRTTAIVGYDHLGTSSQALQLMLDSLTEVYVTSHPRSTFHPKIFTFSGAQRAVAYIGSNNLTVGGTETNFEACVCLDYVLPQEHENYQAIVQLFQALLPDACQVTRRLDPESLAQLIADGDLLDEARAQIPDRPRAPRYAEPRQAPQFAWIPPSPIPADALRRLGAGAAGSQNVGGLRAAAVAIAPAAPVARPIGLAIQIAPHHNGEIFLSRLAVSQNPAFFGFPFNGRTTPKKRGNASYPQRDPDPVVDIEVVGAGGNVLLTMARYSLNTVFYELKSEIRITAAPLVQVVPEYSIMIMTAGGQGVDYDLEIHTPQSPDYQQYLAMCNQQMPSGGRAQPRRFGWI